VIVAKAALLLFVVASPVRAAEPEGCTRPESDWILISTNTTEGPQMHKKLVQHLRAELAVYHILLCGEQPAGGRAPLATVRVEQPSSQRVGIEVRVDDAITHKVVTRQLDLAGLPPDAHAMTVALGAAELLRASWAEINLRSGKPSKDNVPTSVRDAVKPDVAATSGQSRTRRSPATFGLRIAGEGFSHDLRQAGVDADFALEFADRLHVGARLGARQAFSVQAPDGRIRAHGWMGGLTSGVRLTPSDADAHLWILGRVDTERVQFMAEPNPEVNAFAGSGTGVMAGLGIAGSLAVSPLLSLVLESNTGGVLKPVRARDAGREVMAMDGVWLSLSAGMSVSLW
jgi:hypothetical protein